MRPVNDLARALAALEGASVPLTASGSKMLRYMLERPEGCDAWLRSDWFVVQYGWHLAHHRYFTDAGVEVVSWLHDELRGRQGVLPAGMLPTIAPISAWGRDARFIWIARTPDAITIHVRAATSDTLPAALPTPLEPPIEHVVGTLPCPHCGQTPDRYRMLRDGARVCLACGASSLG